MNENTVWAEIRFIFFFPVMRNKELIFFRNSLPVRTKCTRSELSNYQSHSGVCNSPGALLRRCNKDGLRLLRIVLPL